MAKYQLLLPKMGESVAEATVIKWLKQPGDKVEMDDAVLEIATDKVDSEVPSPVSGVLTEQLYKTDDIVQVGAVIAIIETEVVEEEPQAPEPQPVVEAEPGWEPQPEPFHQPVVEEPEIENIPGTELLEEHKIEADTDYTSFKNGSRFYSPLVKHIAQQENISPEELDHIPGTGAEGRLTKDDLLNYVKTRPDSPFIPPVKKMEEFQPQPEIKQPGLQHEDQFEIKQPKKEEPTAEKAQPEVAGQSKATSVSGVDEIIEMDRMRRLIAEHMVMSKHTSPHVSSFVEADVTGLVQWRDKIKTAFEKREGEKITLTPIFIEAVVKAIRDFPMVNVSVNGTQIIKKASINISMATALPNGNLIVPVIKKADELNLLGLTKAINSLANKARTGKLQPDDVKDGTFTITNIGTFGNAMGTPIINQPQVAILAVGTIKKKPAVIETPKGDVIAIRHMMFLSLSYDHRVVDGALGGSFLKRIADYLEDWDSDRVL
jgi:2-oxoglutarate dehydrogenase E2 component (dihydrolipoamide succinyltransferase)